MPYSLRQLAHAEIIIRVLLSFTLGNNNYYCVSTYCLLIVLVIFIPPMMKTSSLLPNCPRHMTGLTATTTLPLLDDFSIHYTLVMCSNIARQRCVQRSTMGKKMWLTTHPRKSGNHVTVHRLSVRTTGTYQRKISGRLW